MVRRSRADADEQLPLFGSVPGGNPAASTTSSISSISSTSSASPTSPTSAAGVGVGRPRSAGVGAADPSPEVLELASALPPELYFGGSTWSFSGWGGPGLVYDRAYATARLAREGLAAYARHPLFRAVGIDRTHYRPLPAADMAAYAAEVPDDFLFLVKAHEVCTLARFPDHARYGAERGRINPQFLDAAYAGAEVVPPFVEGLGGKAGALLFQFAPQDLGSPHDFAARLHRFLTALPPGPRYAVELRNRELLTADYAAALAAAGAVHCLNVHPRMPDVRVQAELTRAAAGALTVGRWLLGGGATYEAASKSFAPFNRLAAPDTFARTALAELAREAIASGRRFLLTVNNNAEGCAPLSIAALVRETLTGDDVAP